MIFRDMSRSTILGRGCSELHGFVYAVPEANSVRKLHGARSGDVHADAISVIRQKRRVVRNSQGELRRIDQFQSNIVSGHTAADQQRQQHID